MIAVYGLPGSIHHRYRQITRKTDAEPFFEECRAYTANMHPAAIGQPTQVLTNKQAGEMRWQSGHPIYWKRNGP